MSSSAQVNRPEIQANPVAHLVRPRSGRRETLAVFTAIGLIMMVMALRALLQVGDQEQVQLLPSQRLDTVLTGSQRVVYQSLLASTAEIEALRAEQGRWPDVERLRAESVPPFDSTTLPLRYHQLTWSAHDAGAWVDYVGSDGADAELGTFLFRAIDLQAGGHPHPHAGIEYQPGMQVAFQVWNHGQSARPYPGESLTEDGWKQLVSPGDPSLTAVVE